jgi:predicted amidohydrolase
MEDQACGNLVRNPEFTGHNQAAEGWVFWAPRPELAPSCQIRDLDRGRSLLLAANGDKRIFGCWRGEADFEDGQWYRASVWVKIKNIPQPDYSVCAHFAQHFLVPEAGWAEVTLLTQTFRYQSGPDGNHVELFLRSTETGSVEWREPSLVKIDPPRHRIARVVTTRFDGNSLSGELTLAGQRSRIADKLAQAGVLHPDLTVMTEFCQTVGVAKKYCPSCQDVAETVPDGPTSLILAEAAKKCRMYVIAGLIERRGRYLFNTAVLFDRQGNLMGQYDKTHLTFGELLDGISCGGDYPLFDLDFGRIGIHICYDQWFPEISRYYARQGAELLVLPVAGGKPVTWRTRALDNGIYFISASVTPPSMIIDSSGAILAETQGDGLVFADLDLDLRKTNWYGDPTLRYGMPCIVRQMENTLDDRWLRMPGAR